MSSRRQQQIAELEARVAQLRKRQQLIEARQRALNARRDRREDTRRKILIGAIVLAKVEQGVLAESTLREWLDAALTRADDRRLFELSGGAS